MNKNEKINQGEEKESIYEINSKLTFGNGFNFGFGFGIGFFISGLIITIVTGYILFTIFGAVINSFQESISDPFGLKGSSYSQPVPSSSQLEYLKLLNNR